MNIQGSYNAEDLQAATWVHLRPRRFMGAVGLSLLALLFWGILVRFFGPTSGDGPNGLKWFALALLCYLLVASFVVIPRRCRRTFSQRKDLHRPCAFSVSQAGLVFENEHVVGTYPWSDFVKWKEGKSVILLYMSDNMCHVLPKRFFSSEQELQEFRAFVSGHVKRVEA